MSAPQIPNLLSLRGGRSRGPGRGQGHAPRAPLADAAQQQQNVQGTDTDANHSRLSAVNVGYLEDRFAAELSGSHAPRRFPIINRGTYVRTTAIDKLVQHFLTAHPNRDVQIISLGAGTDTRYFRLRDQTQHKRLLYHEIDFPAMSAQKLAMIGSSRALSPPDSGFYSLHPIDLSPNSTRWGYFSNDNRSRGFLFHPLDLQTLHDTPTLNHLDGLATGLPTLLVSECCLCYLEPHVADAVLDYFTARIKDLAVVVYEPTNPTSAFGKVMMANLAARDLYMPAVLAYPSLEAQCERLRKRGFTGGQNGASVEWLWERWVGQAEKERLAGLEGLDEVEEWVLLASHYLVFWAWRGRGKKAETEAEGKVWEGVSGMKGGGEMEGGRTPTADEGMVDIKEEEVETKFVMPEMGKTPTASDAMDES